MQLSHTTDRLLLRVLSSDESLTVLDFYSKNKNFFEPFEPNRCESFYTQKYHQASLAYEFDLFCQHKYMRLWIFEKSHPETAIGTICFSNILKGAFQSCMVGYKLDASHCNKGYAKEALLHAVKLIFQEYGLHRIEALVLPNNTPSVKLLEGVGFELEGVAQKSINLNGEWKDHLRYALIKTL